VPHGGQAHGARADTPLGVAGSHLGGSCARRLQLLPENGFTLKAIGFLDCGGKFSLSF